MDCDYTNPDDILIDCIIDGVHDRMVQEWLLDRDEALTFPKAIKVCQQVETSRKQVQIVRGQEEDPSVTEIHKFKQKSYLKKKAMQSKLPYHRCGTANSIPGQKVNVYL